MRKILFIFLMISGCAVSAQTVLDNYRPGITAEGAVFYLPKTAVRVTIRYVITKYTPGEYCNYAERYFNAKDVGTQESQTYAMSSIKLNAIGVPDTSKCFALIFNAKSVASNVRLSENGILLAINAEPMKMENQKPFVGAPKPARLNPQDYMTEEIMSAGSMAKKAELTAHEIFDIRDSKNQLTRGEADNLPKDGAQLKIMLDNLNNQESALTQLFLGTTVCDTIESTMTIIPKEDVSKMILFRFSHLLGLVDDDDLSGIPYYLSVVSQPVAKADIKDADEKKGKTLPFGNFLSRDKRENGVYVNVPGKMNIRIFTSQKLWATSDFDAAQFGNVELLSDKLFNKKYTTSVVLNPVTGALMRLDAEQPK